MRVLRLQVLARQRNSLAFNLFAMDSDDKEMIGSCAQGWISSADFQRILQKLGAKRIPYDDGEMYEVALPDELLTGGG